MCEVPTVASGIVIWRLCLGYAKAVFNRSPACALSLAPRPQPQSPSSHVAWDDSSSHIASRRLWHTSASLLAAALLLTRPPPSLTSDIRVHCPAARLLIWAHVAWASTIDDRGIFVISTEIVVQNLQPSNPQRAGGVARSIT